VKSLKRTGQNKEKIVPNKPMPSDVDLSIPGIGKAWENFQELDVDGGGVLDWDEMCELAKKVGLEWKTRKLRKAYFEMNPLGTGVGFPQFAIWWSRQQAVARRESRRQVKELFDQYDDDKSGVLDQGEFGKMVAQAEKYLKGLKFDMEENWDELKKVPCSETEMGVNFSAFETWWKLKAQVMDPDIPVLPEFMVMKIGEKSMGSAGWNGGDAKVWRLPRAHLVSDLPSLTDG
jgi:Ca2+-binding EF-hand superfamily protein